MLIGACTELVAIGSVLPFLELLASPGSAAEQTLFTRLLQSVGAEPGSVPLLPATLFLIAATVLAAGVRLLILWSTQRFVLGLGHEIGVEIHRRMLRQPYIYYLNRNPSELFSSVEKVDRVVFGVLLPAMQGLIASVLALAILGFLIALDPKTASISAGIVGSIYLCVSAFARARLKRNSREMSQVATHRMKAIQEGLGGIRDILLGQKQHVFDQKYRELDYRYRRAQSENMFISQAPRYVIEAFGIIVIGLIAAYLSTEPGGLIRSLPTLGAMALAAHRLLPLVQQSFHAWSQIAGHTGVIEDVNVLLTARVPAKRLPDYPVRPFTDDIVLHRVSLSYPGRELALRGIDLRILKGERVGLMGTTGSGKSSLLDILMGLLEPSSGELRVDGALVTPATVSEWQAQIAHVPQSVYLADSSIAANIAFGETEAEIDFTRVREVAAKAQLHDFILSLPDGYATEVGERGVRLSGGQRQRIALARALYQRASFLILDEATGALDRETEQAVMESIEALGREVTLLVVAHRASALALCDRIIRLEEGKIVEAAEDGGSLVSSVR
jgi:ABC-type multidrug transport system fused ATPase/permease subunit